MQVYSYSAIDSSGREVRGRVSAAGQAQAADILRLQGLAALTVKEQRVFDGRITGLNKADFIRFLTEFTALNRAGLTVPEALEQCADRPSNKPLTSALKRILSMLREGISFSDSFASFPGLFDNLLVSAIRTGESAGDLVPPLVKYREHLEKRRFIRNKINNALAYPAFILCAMVLILAGLFVFVMPRFTSLYADFDAELPLPTKIVMFAAEHAGTAFPAVVVAVVVLFAVYGYAVKFKKIRLFTDFLKYKLPVAGVVIKELDHASFASTMHTLLSGGMPLAEALRTALFSVNNAYYAKKVEKVIERVYGGQGFASAAKAEGVFEGSAVKLLEAGEASGTIDTMLAEAASMHEESAAGRLSVLMTLIEPAMILLTGLIVGTIIVVMYLPVFRLTEIIK